MKNLFYKNPTERNRIIGILAIIFMLSLIVTLLVSCEEPGRSREDLESDLDFQEHEFKDLQREFDDLQYDHNKLKQSCESCESEKERLQQELDEAKQLIEQLEASGLLYYEEPAPKLKKKRTSSPFKSKVKLFK